MKIRYICKHCDKANSIDSVWKWFWTPHFGAKKYLNCRHCYAKRHFMKRWDGQKWIDLPKEGMDINHYDVTYYNTYYRVFDYSIYYVIL